MTPVDGATLSQKALVHGALLKHLDVTSLANRLYSFYAWPVPIRGLAAWPPTDFALDNFGYRCQQTDRGPWIRWRLHDGPTPRWKLYVSPAPREMAATLRRTLEVGASMQVPAVKVGGDIANIHRPDKLIAYVQDRKALRELAVELASALSGTTPHGVPFAVPCEETGLLFQGQDQAGCSWRAHVCKAAARILVTLRHLDAFAAADECMARLQAEGVSFQRLPEATA